MNALTKSTAQTLATMLDSWADDLPAARKAADELRRLDAFTSITEAVAYRYRINGDLQWQYTERMDQTSHADEVQHLSLGKQDMTNNTDTDGINEIFGKNVSLSNEQCRSLTSIVRTEYVLRDQEQNRPSVIYKPKLYTDGNKWCALYGDHLQSGLVGFGDTPALAMSAFDNEWNTAKPYSRNHK